MPSLRLGSAVRTALAIWGACCLAVVVVLASHVVHALATFGAPRLDRAEADDVRFVLNWCELGDERIAEVVHSYESRTPLIADHLVAYAIRTTELDSRELDGSLPNQSGRPRLWRRGDRLDTLSADAIDFAVPTHEVPWFPTRDELKSQRYFVYRHRVSVSHGVDFAMLIFARPADRMVFYVSYQS